MTYKVEIWVKSAAGLKGPDLMDKVDPLVRVFLDDVEVMKTKPKKNEENPVWDEKAGVMVEGEKSAVRFAVMDKDKFTKEDFVGEASVSVEEVKNLGTMDCSVQLVRNMKAVGVLFVKISWTEL